MESNRDFDFVRFHTDPHIIFYQFLSEPRGLGFVAVTDLHGVPAGDGLPANQG
jgi:hypothetical protein